MAARHPWRVTLDPPQPASLWRELIGEIRGSSCQERVWALVFLIQIVVIVVGLLALGRQPQTGGPG